MMLSHLIGQTIIRKLSWVSHKFQSVYFLNMSSYPKYDPENRKKYETLTKEEKRKFYKCKDAYITLDKVPTWQAYAKEKWGDKGAVKSELQALSEQISLWRGDITLLEIDAIVNAANTRCMGGGGVDGAIHRAAGNLLVSECSTLGGCETGNAKITCGYKLPAKYVIHTVGPIGENTNDLRSCYKKCLELCTKNELKSIAFPCISTGVYGYPNEPASKVALSKVTTFLREDPYAKEIDRIIFCVFLEKDVGIYEEALRNFFSTSTSSLPLRDDRPSSTGSL